MLKLIAKILVFFFWILILTTCIDPYYPELGKYQSLLVVEGIVTDADTPVNVRLSRTFQSADSIPQKISDALVFITDEDDNRTDLHYAGDGNYKTIESSGYKGQAGKIYTLHVKTSDGREYLSEPCVMLPVPAIDSVYFDRVEEVYNNNNSTSKGIMIFLDTDETTEDECYLRWEFEETWKFKLPYPKRYEYINDSVIIKLNDTKEYCWKTNLSGEILINQVLPGQGSIKKVPLCFISPEISDRLTVQYSIIVKQYSISTEEYNYWENLKKVNETTGDIFDTQPYSVISNIHNTSDPADKVLGYFMVSSVREKRIYITSNELLGLELPGYNYSCTEHIVDPYTYWMPGSQGKPPTWDEINEMFMSVGGFTFVRPMYVGETDELDKLVFATLECSDCSKTGIITQPDFWIDLP
jgi:hypothetical protein